jgi:hypothetical protein
LNDGDKPKEERERHEDKATILSKDSQAFKLFLDGKSL